VELLGKANVSISESGGHDPVSAGSDAIDPRSGDFGEKAMATELSDPS